MEPADGPRLVVEPLRADAPGAEDWLRTVAGWHHDECVSRGIRSSLARRTEQLRAHLDASPIPVTLLAHKGPEPLGCVSLVRYQASAGGHDRVWLSNLYVRADVRRRGLGEALLKRVLAYAGEQQLPGLWLFTDQWQDFYRKRGWHPSGDAHLSGSDVDILCHPLC